KWAAMNENGFWSDATFTAPAWRTAFNSGSKKFEFTASENADGSNQAFQKPERFAAVKPEGDDLLFPTPQD
ncbi:hypothetical protein ACFLZM_08525, partial [Thermodesulfobacteriota bacterium]